MVNKYYRFNDDFKPDKPLIDWTGEIEDTYYYNGYIIQLYKDGGGVNISRKENYLGLNSTDKDYRLKRAIEVIDEKIAESEKTREERRNELIKKFTKFIDKELM